MDSVIPSRHDPVHEYDAISYPILYLHSTLLLTMSLCVLFCISLGSMSPLCLFRRDNIIFHRHSNILLTTSPLVILTISFFLHLPNIHHDNMSYFCWWSCHHQYRVQGWLMGWPLAYSEVGCRELFGMVGEARERIQLDAKSVLLGIYAFWICCWGQDHERWLVVGGVSIPMQW